MASASFHPLVRRLRGKSGDYVFKQRNGSAYLARVPDFENLEPTEAQRSARMRFLKASRYAKLIHADEQARAPYVAAAEGQSLSAFNLIFRDYYHAPVVESVELSGYNGQVGNTIEVTATDDFQVTGVEVKIMDANDAEIESGVAVVTAAEPDTWTYTATVAVQNVAGVKVVATASDRCGNKTEKVASKQ